jgi:hypothetical protein
MSFQWLNMRITEEQDRRQQEAVIMARLPKAMDEVCEALTGCLEAYTGAFGPEAAELQVGHSQIHVLAREERDGEWEELASVDLFMDLSVPGFRIEREGAEPLIIEVGLLPGDKVYYRDRGLDQYVSMDEVTHRALDRVLFPKLRA